MKISSMIRIFILLIISNFFAMKYFIEPADYVKALDRSIFQGFALFIIWLDLQLGKIFSIGGK